MAIYKGNNTINHFWKSTFVFLQEKININIPFKELNTYDLFEYYILKLILTFRVRLVDMIKIIGYDNILYLATIC